MSSRALVDKPPAQELKTIHGRRGRRPSPTHQGQLSTSSSFSDIIVRGQPRTTRDQPRTQQPFAFKHGDNIRDKEMRRDDHIRLLAHQKIGQFAGMQAVKHAVGE